MSALGGDHNWLRYPGVSDQLHFAKMLKAFHHFLVQEYKLPTQPKTLGVGRSSVPVDANIFLPGDYQYCLDALQRGQELVAVPTSIVAEYRPAAASGRS